LPSIIQRLCYTLLVTSARQIPTDKYKYACCLATVAFSQDASTEASQLACEPSRAAKQQRRPNALNSNAEDFGGIISRPCMMSGSRPQQSAGGAGSVPSTSSSSTSSSNSSSSTGGGGTNAVTSNGNNSGNIVPSRTLPAASEGTLSVPTLAAVPSSRGGFASLSRPSASSGSRKKSLHQAPLYNGLLNSYEDKTNDFVWLVSTGASGKHRFGEKGESIL